jgi:acetolactate synthase-1/2/3 large subunit
VKVSDYIADFLVEHGVEYVFVFTGGAIAHVVDSVFRRHLSDGSLKPICVMHEQAGAMALDGYTRATGRIGAMAVTSGPGATNLLTGVACSYYDSIPGLYFTGQVRSWEYKGGSPQRQVGFQETDIVSIASPITKYSVMVKDPLDIRYELEKALFLARSGRPGPVLIDLPMDLQWAEVTPRELRRYRPDEADRARDRHSLRTQIRKVASMIAESRHPVIISGGGIRNAKATEELRALATHADIPVVVTFNGLDSFPHDNPLYCGLIGMMGHHAANATVEKGDLVLALGTRLALRQVRSRPQNFAPNARLVHVDIDSSEVNKRVPTDVGLAVDAKEFLSGLLDELRGNGHLSFSAHAAEARAAFTGRRFGTSDVYEQNGAVNPYVFFRLLSQQMADDDVLICDAGQNVMVGMQASEVRARQRVFTAAAHSPMGYSLPAAMGVAASYRGKPRVICTIGDGGVQLNIQELQTIYSYALPVIVFVMNNHSYGAIQDYQDSALDSRYYATSSGYGYEPPDILAIARAYKIPTAQISSQENLAAKISEILEGGGPIVCDVDLGPRTHVALDP